MIRNKKVITLASVLILTMPVFAYADTTIISGDGSSVGTFYCVKDTEGWTTGVTISCRADTYDGPSFENCNYQWTIAGMDEWTEIGSESNWSFTAYENGNYEVNMIAYRDDGLHADTNYVQVTNIDNTAPMITNYSQSTYDETTGPVTLTFDCEDYQPITNPTVEQQDIGSGLHNDGPYSYDGGNTWTWDNTYTAYSNGVIHFAVRDNLGNTNWSDIEITNIAGSASEPQQPDEQPQQDQGDQTNNTNNGGNDTGSGGNIADNGGSNTGSGSNIADNGGSDTGSGGNIADNGGSNTGSGGNIADNGGSNTGSGGNTADNGESNIGNTTTVPAITDESIAGNGGSGSGSNRETTASDGNGSGETNQSSTKRESSTDRESTSRRQTKASEKESNTDHQTDKNRQSDSEETKEGNLAVLFGSTLDNDMIKRLPYIAGGLIGILVVIAGSAVYLIGKKHRSEAESMGAIVGDKDMKDIYSSVDNTKAVVGDTADQDEIYVRKFERNPENIYVPEENTLTNKINETSFESASTLSDQQDLPEEAVDDILAGQAKPSDEGPLVIEGEHSRLIYDPETGEYKYEFK